MPGLKICENGPQIFSLVLKKTAGFCYEYSSNCNRCFYGNFFFFSKRGLIYSSKAIYFLSTGFPLNHFFSLDLTFNFCPLLLHLPLLLLQTLTTFLPSSTEQFDMVLLRTVKPGLICVSTADYTLTW